MPKPRKFESSSPDSENPSDFQASVEETPATQDPQAEPTSPSTPPPPPPSNRGKVMNLREMKEKKIGDLIELAKEFNIEGAAGMRRQELFLPSWMRWPTKMEWSTGMEF